MRRALVAACLFAACAPGSWDEFRAELATRSCALSVACGELAAAERGRCTSPVLFNVIMFSSDFDVPTAIAAGQINYVPDGAGRCLDAVRDAPCEPGAQVQKILLGCNRVVAPATVVGSACWAGGQCQGGQCVQPGVFFCPGVCVAYPSPGEACDATAFAPALAACDTSVEYCGSDDPDAGAAFTCRIKKQRGDKCDSDVECSFGLQCGGVCEEPPRGKVGDACGGGMCDDTVFCGRDGRCAEQRERGQACDGPFACNKGLACIGFGVDSASAAVTLGACAPWLDGGAACNAGGGTLTLASGCAASQACVAGVCTPNNPTLVSGFGAGCDAAHACAPQYFCDAGVCHDPVGRGGSCSSSAACSPGLSCDPVEHHCLYNQSCP